MRMALGAQRLHVLRLVFGQGFLLLLIGTVIGLAGSMSMTSRLDEDGFLSQATRHLTFAFDCTLVALALSLVLMFLLHSVQRDEEALVIDCQQYCLEHLVARLYNVEPEHAGAYNAEAGGTTFAPAPRSWLRQR